MARTLDDDTRQAVALFRYGLIADLAHLPPGTPGTGERLRAKATQDYVIPGTTRTRVAAETLRHWLTAYRQGGFDALYPKNRTDRGPGRPLRRLRLRREHHSLPAGVQAGSPEKRTTGALVRR